MKVVVGYNAVFIALLILLVTNSYGQTRNIENEKPISLMYLQLGDNPSIFNTGYGVNFSIAKKISLEPDSKVNFLSDYGGLYFLDSANLVKKKHSVYGEFLGPGRLFSSGYCYSYNIMKDVYLNFSVGIGGDFRLINPFGGLVGVFSLDLEFFLNKWFAINSGVGNSLYMNYWGVFSKVPKNCYGVGICPPDYAYSLVPFVGVNFIAGRFTFSPRWNAFFSISPHYYPYYFYPSFLMRVRVNKI